MQDWAHREGARGPDRMVHDELGQAGVVGCDPKVFVARDPRGACS